MKKKEITKKDLMWRRFVKFLKSEDVYEAFTTAVKNEDWVQNMNNLKDNYTASEWIMSAFSWTSDYDWNSLHEEWTRKLIGISNLEEERRRKKKD